MIALLSRLPGVQLLNLAIEQPEHLFDLFRRALDGLLGAASIDVLVRRQSFSDIAGVLVTEALARFQFQVRRRRLGAATGVFGWSAS